MTSHKQIAGYILGKLSEEEAERFEATLFASDGALEEALIVEDELVEAYTRGDLTGDERRALETGALASRLGQDRVMFFSALTAQADKHTAPASAGLWKTLSAWLWPANPGARVVLVGAMAALLAFGGMRLLDSGGSQGAVASLQLSSINVRSIGRLPTLLVSDNTTSVELVLVLEADEPFEQFEAVLRQGNKEVWRSESGSAENLAFTVRVPANLLLAGQCEVELVGIGKTTETVAFFLLMIQKP